MDRGRTISGVVFFFSAVLLMAPYACSGDPDPATPSGQGGAGTAGAGPGTGGTAGAGGEPSACGNGCPIQCDVSLASPSAGMCVNIGGANACNPVTNEGCNGIIGEVCDFGPAGFRCYGGDNDVSACGDCSKTRKCFKGFTCDAEFGACAKFCCNDQDCATGGTCVPIALGVGTCQGGGTGPGPAGPGSGGMGGMPAGPGPGPGPTGGMGGMPVGPGGMGGMPVGPGGMGGVGVGGMGVGGMGVGGN